MTIEQIAILVALLTQTGGFVWWAATLTAIVKQHGKDLERHNGELGDHDLRLRKGDL